MMRLTSGEIVRRLIENEVTGTTKNPEHAIYVLPDGTLIDGQFEYGCRGIDHRCIEFVMDGENRYTKGFWNDVFRDTGAVMLIPETKQYTYPKYMGKQLTWKQNKVIGKLMLRGYEYEEF